MAPHPRLPNRPHTQVEALGYRSPELELIESSPIETTLDHGDIRDARAVWPQLIAASRSSLDIAQFYVTSEQGSPMEPVLDAIAAALLRGVRVRLLIDQMMAEQYPEPAARLAALGAEVRRIDFRPYCGGVLHAKYFVVDNREAFVGSQNFDWRALSHIQELGVRIASPLLVQSLGALFEADWALAKGNTTAFREARTPPPTASYLFEYGEPIRVALGFSPKGWLPTADAAQDQEWDLPRLVALIEGAQQTIRLQLLIYDRQKADATPDSPMAQLESALVRAAARGVSLELLLSEWELKKSPHAATSRIPAIPGAHIKVVTIPRFSGGDIPYARVTHAKYMVVDGKHIWIGTSNFEDRYFLRSRNISVFIDSAHLGSRLDRFFADVFYSRYAAPVKIPG